MRLEVRRAHAKPPANGSTAAIEGYPAGELPPEPEKGAAEEGLAPEEAQVLAFLEEQLEEGTAG